MFLIRVPSHLKPTHTYECMASTIDNLSKIEMFFSDGLVYELLVHIIVS